MTVAEKLTAIMFRGWPYDVWLGRRTPSNIEGPGMNAMLSAEAAWYADGTWPIIQPPKDEQAGHFRWLASATLGADGAPLGAWLNAHDRWDAHTWRADLAGERLVRWLDAYVAADKTTPVELKASWTVAILRTAKHLNRIKAGNGPTWQRFFVHQGRIAAALMIPEMRATLPAALARLGTDVDTQILRDGGHISRAPQIALTVLAILIEIQTALLAHHIEPPTGLVSAIDRMVPFIKAMLFGDGGFALMGGATDTTADLIERVITMSASKARAMTSATHTGYQRIRAGQTTVLFDCGKTRTPDEHHHAPASFEIAVGKVRLIGNCGRRLGESSPAWTQALTSTAAHTALVIKDTDADTVQNAKVTRRDHEGARLIEAAHDGYRKFGIAHTRSIYVDAGGTDIRGEDVLSGGSSQPVSIRFHLHPDVRASMVEGGGEVILKPPRGKGWRFHCRHPVMLEDSVSFHDGRQHRSQQITVLGNHEPEATTIKWRLAMQG